LKKHLPLRGISAHFKTCNACPLCAKRTLDAVNVMSGSPAERDTRRRHWNVRQGSSGFSSADALFVLPWRLFNKDVLRRNVNFALIAASTRVQLRLNDAQKFRTWRDSLAHYRWGFARNVILREPGSPQPRLLLSFSGAYSNCRPLGI
jgi:hypothetical protein